jgi:hypothetical protein
MHVREFGIQGFEGLLVEACIHTQAYDPQCEGDRAPWLVKIIDAAGVEQRIVPRMLDGFHLATSDNRFWDLLQLCRLAREFAGRGHEDARRALYQAFQKSSDSIDLIGGEEIVDLDGADGLIHLAQIMGSWIAEQPDIALDDSPLGWYDERHGDGAAIRVLEACARQDQNVAVYLRHLTQDAATDTPDTRRMWRCLDQVRIDQDRLEERNRREQAIDASDVIRDIEDSNPEENRMKFMGWGRKANEDDLRTIASRMFAETHPGRLVKYLCIFTRRPLPEFDRRLVALADHPDEDVRWRALRVLANHEHPAVRSLALDRIHSGRIGEGELRLFRKNYRSGDQILIDGVLHPPEDREVLHALVFDLTDVFGENPTSELHNAMLFVYEQSPCSNCRRKTVDALLSTKQAPGWVIRECEHDVDEDIRDAVR